MSNPSNLPDLEAALIERAERLAEEYLAKGRDGRKAILKAERDRLHRRKARITDELQGDAERLFRRRVQAATLKLQGTLDRERWNLIQSIIDELPERLCAVAADANRYDELLIALLAQAASSIDATDLVVRMNERDRQRQANSWADFVARAAPRKKVELATETIDCNGGMLVSSRDDTVRIDATFEGRAERFSGELVLTIAERLFPSADLHMV